MISGIKLSRLIRSVAVLGSLVLPGACSGDSSSDNTEITSPTPDPPAIPPTLLEPAPGAILDNSCWDLQELTDLVEWKFSWTPVSGASLYHIFVIGDGASAPVIDAETSNTTYTYVSTVHYIADVNREGWRWRVRSRVGSVWSDWSSERMFDVEPLNTDCLTITTTSLPIGTWGQPYSANLEATGGDGEYTWSITQGELPEGLDLEPGGTIAGTTTQTGSQDLTFGVESGNGLTDVVTLELTIQACSDETGMVEMTVTEDPSVVFDWEPPCSAAFFLVEEDGADKWGVLTDEDTWNDPSAANLIEPPVVYGVVPDVPGIGEFIGPEELVPGVTYHVGFWRALPQGSQTNCVNRFGNMCLMVNHSFELQ